MKTGFTQKLGADKAFRFSSLSAFKLWVSPCVVFATVWLAGMMSLAGEYPEATQQDFVIHDFHFQSGENLPELRMHYRTLGTPQRNQHGIVTNAILILHGTTGSSGQFMRLEFAGELFGK